MSVVDAGQFLIIGERINTTRKRVREAVRERNAEFIATEARKQAAAGAHYLDVNAGADPRKEADDLKWLVETVQAAVDLPLCLDSPSAKALKDALPLVKKTPMINSITAEPDRLKDFLPLVKKAGGPVVGLCMSAGGMPCGVQDRIKAVEAMCAALDKAGIARTRAYFDPCIAPVAISADEAQAVIEAVRRIRNDFGGAHTTCGLSNISYGLPQRNLLNRTFLALLIGAGLDGAIMDPTEPQMAATVVAGLALMGRDSFCMNYIQAERAGMLGEVKR
jgi:5-methyltetrahydrofolate--homocysteine methyltransferase